GATARHPGPGSTSAADRDRGDGGGDRDDPSATTEEYLHHDVGRRWSAGWFQGVAPGSPTSHGGPLPRPGREPEPGLRELALGEREDLGRDNLEHERFAPLVVEGAVVHVEVPVALVLRLPRVGEAPEEGIVGDPPGDS